MKNQHLVFETVLISITILILLNSLLADNFIIYLAWWFIFGFLQVIHAMLLGFAFSKTPAIWRYLKWYFIGVFMEFLLILLKRPIETNSPLQVLFPYGIFILWIFPAMLASYLWFITWYFRRSSAQLKKSADY